MTSYEWGVVYSGMLLAAETTGDPAFKDYVARRLALVATLADHYRAHPVPNGPLRSVLEPRALDDAGSLCAAMIKASRAGVAADLRPMIDNFIGFISTKEFRLADGTLARNRPQPSTLWLDDLYMGVPALAQMGKLTGERRYTDDAVKQVLQFSPRMFNREQGLFMHGWVQGQGPVGQAKLLRSDEADDVVDHRPQSRGDARARGLDHRRAQSTRVVEGVRRQHRAQRTAGDGARPERAGRVATSAMRRVT